MLIIHIDLASRVNNLGVNNLYTVVERTKQNDLALVQLPYNVSLTQDTNPICLPDESVNFKPGERCTVIGWGRTATAGMKCLPRYHDY